jgi:hypothetical protein
MFRPHDRLIDTHDRCLMPSVPAGRVSLGESKFGYGSCKGTAPTQVPRPLPQPTRSIIHIWWGGLCGQNDKAHTWQSYMCSVSYSHFRASPKWILSTRFSNQNILHEISFFICASRLPRFNRHKLIDEECKPLNPLVFSFLTPSYFIWFRFQY